MTPAQLVTAKKYVDMGVTASQVILSGACGFLGDTFPVGRAGAVLTGTLLSGFIGAAAELGKGKDGRAADGFLKGAGIGLVVSTLVTAGQYAFSHLPMAQAQVEPITSAVKLPGEMVCNAAEKPGMPEICCYPRPATDPSTAKMLTTYDLYVLPPRPGETSPGVNWIKTGKELASCSTDRMFMGIEHVRNIAHNMFTVRHIQHMPLPPEVR